jgi:hypothetical protein
MDDKVIELMLEDIREIKKDVKRLIGFRMLLLGGSAVVAAITSTALLIIFGR